MLWIYSVLKQKNGFTPLHYAAIGNQCPIIHLLLQRKPVVDARDNNRQTPLHHAAKYNFVKIAEILLDSVGSNYCFALLLKQFTYH